MKISAGKVVIPIRAAPKARPIRAELRIRSLPWFGWSLLIFFILSLWCLFLVFFHILSWPDGRGWRILGIRREGWPGCEVLACRAVTGHGLENLASRRLELCWTFSSGLQLDGYLGWPCCIVEIELPYGAVGFHGSVASAPKVCKSCLSCSRAYLWSSTYYICSQ